MNAGQTFENKVIPLASMALRVLAWPYLMNLAAENCASVARTEADSMLLL
jgi:hypothetical protein